MKPWWELCHVPQDLTLDQMWYKILGFTSSHTTHNNNDGGRRETLITLQSPSQSLGCDGMGWRRKTWLFAGSRGAIITIIIFRPMLQIPTLPLTITNMLVIFPCFNHFFDRRSTQRLAVVKTPTFIYDQRPRVSQSSFFSRVVVVLINGFWDLYMIQFQKMRDFLEFIVSLPGKLNDDCVDDGYSEARWLHSALCMRLHKTSRPWRGQR